MLNRLIQARANRALQQAVANDDSTTLRKVISKGADINTPYAIGNTPAAVPIQQALISMSVDCLALLLEAGAQLPDGDNEQFLLLDMAISSPRAQLTLLSTLLTHGLDPNAAAGKAFFRCLQHPDDNLRLLLLTRLMEHGGNINISNSQGHSPLTLLLLEQNLQLIGTLISAGATLPANLDKLPCDETVKQFARRRQEDLATRRLLQGLD